MPSRRLTIRRVRPRLGSVWPCSQGRRQP
jgi:hypothetical protein